MNYHVRIGHTFETAHRLPHLAGKCASLHGHSWRVTVAVVAPNLSTDGTVVEFGALKATIRQWIDTHLDHGTMLGVSDPLVGPLETADCKVFRFGTSTRPAASSAAEALAADLAWPTVEAVAVVLHRMSEQVLTTLPHTAQARVSRVFVRETPVNAADYGPGEAP
jgi:6-pyruvoyltetrahydropterin/6-carboxytetrahydropterin synthase